MLVKVTFLGWLARKILIFNMEDNSINIPNILTISRVFMVPFFVFLLNANFNIWALVIFILASITDAIDGFVARKYNLITNFGKFLDPLADKVLTISAFVCFLKLNITNVWVVLIIITREFLVMFIRLMAMQNKIVLAANLWGKIKTISQMVACIFSMLYLISPVIFLKYIYEILIYISVLFTILSGGIYLYSNKKLFE